MQHALRSAGVDTLARRRPAGGGGWPGLALGRSGVRSGRRDAGAGAAAGRPRQPLPPGTAKITFTSGTTGAPKGVCLTRRRMQRVAQGLVEAMAPLDIRRHLSALPFAVLLENIAGLMAPLAARRHRASRCRWRELGLSGSSSFDAARFHAAVRSATSRTA